MRPLAAKSSKIGHYNKTMKEFLGDSLARVRLVAGVPDRHLATETIAAQAVQISGVGCVAVPDHPEEVLSLTLKKVKRRRAL